MIYKNFDSFLVFMVKHSMIVKPAHRLS